jgi:uncharacterized protein DUF3105
MMSVTTRRERRERELRRRQRQNHGNEPSRGGRGGRGPIIGVVAIVAIVAIVLGLRGAGVLSRAPVASPLPTIGAVASDDPALGVREPEVSRGHVPVGQSVTYPTLPPTSGDHWSSVSPPAPPKAGVYDSRIPFEITTHGLEHGGIVIVYNGLSADDTAALRDYIKRTLDSSKYRKVLLEPYPELQGAKIVATAWTWRLNLQSFDALSLQKFIQAHYDSQDSPEPGVAWN